MSPGHSKTVAVGILCLHAGEDVNFEAAACCALHLPVTTAPNGDEALRKYQLNQLKGLALPELMDYWSWASAQAENNESSKVLWERDFVRSEVESRICASQATSGWLPFQTYSVGGAVRDRLLGRPVNDCDWVVVGGWPRAMQMAGYKPVGADFPVFLHPQTGEEYALARTERKTAPGYRDFEVHSSPTVSLEEDLGRRDLTINAMAESADGSIIDPYGGQADLQARVLRHVSSAFAEDPVRILRLARFAARYTDFTVAPETIELMRCMVDAGEVDALVPERVWQELSRGLMETRPSRMFEVLRACGALARLLPEVDCLWGIPQPPEHHPEVDTGVHVMMVLDIAAQLNAPLTVRFACLCHDLGKGTTPADVLPRHIQHELRSVDLLHPLCDRLKVPNECQEVAAVTAREHGNIHGSLGLAPAALMRLLERCDAIRRPVRFEEALLSCECDARGRLNFSDRPYPQRPRLLAALHLARAVNTKEVAERFIAKGRSGPEIGEAIYAARVAAISAGYASLPHHPLTAESPPAADRRRPKP